ncbi:PepSY domain-containing protein [Sphingomicrobium lutaoense]|uniref:PepSY domain-containing protein n=1 Tax=Sphingomicrobium lutaoense TaxID=515949 RepID=A0A839Z186_9SPHN|nr:PepSY domain-containing protein [Sphingomicrobium lutaoense]MBB3764318.1 hypothetical protein [Sphingomicrobium lutaoense]
MINRKRLRKWHLWLGWLVGVPFLIWTVSGLVMVWKPIEEVRGTDLIAPATAFQLESEPVLPAAARGVPIEGARIEHRMGGPRWVVGLSDGSERLADPATGQWLPAYGADEASAEVMARYQGDSRIRSVSRTDPDDPPMDWRRPVAAWQVEMENGDRFYVDEATGAISARRTSWWRVFDFFWGLHIMDLQTREDTSNLWIKSFAIFSIVMTVLALILLPMSTGRKKRRKRRSAGE